MPNLVCLLGVVDDCSGSNTPIYLLLLFLFLFFPDSHSWC